MTNSSQTMTQAHTQRRRYPLVIAILLIGFGITLGLSLFFMFHLHVYITLLYLIEPYLPWITLLVGITLTLLIASLTYLVQVAKHQTAEVSRTNESLTHEANERILAEEAKQKLEVALLQGQKLQAIGTLAGGIAHDFNNILYAITGYAEMSRDDVNKGSQVHANLGKIVDACSRGKDLVSRILTFSRKQHPHFESINIKQTIESALALLKPTIPSSVLIEHHLTNCFILGNQTQLHQVIVNLINNAVDAMEGEGKITITLNHLNPASTHANKGQRHCQLQITDTGHGMDRTTSERIFEPFFTTKEVGKGTGLGLSIAHTIISEHNGSISVESQLGHGSTFKIVLPEQAV